MFFNENYKTLKRETEEDIRRWKDVPYSWIGTTNILKKNILPKQFTCSMQFLSK
jgi:hypothetical protein